MPPIVNDEVASAEDGLAGVNEGDNVGEIAGGDSARPTSVLFADDVGGPGIANADREDVEGRDACPGRVAGWKGSGVVGRDCVCEGVKLGGGDVGREVVV